MTFNESIRYEQGVLYADSVPVQDIVEQTGTPVYVYSLRRALSNLRRIRAAFVDFDLHVHYSAKANASLAILRTLVAEGAGVDAVSAGEIHAALAAGADASQVVFAGVGKSPAEIHYAVEKGVGWFNVENEAELALIQAAAALRERRVRVALRLNPEVTATTHPYIATGHGGAKFGLTADVIARLLANQADYANLDFAGIHVHVGSQLGDTTATRAGVTKALSLIQPYPAIRTINIGGGMPADYGVDGDLPILSDFAAVLKPLLQDYTVLLEPGRSIIADAGLLVTEILYVKHQAGQTLYIVDGSMTELIRPALYQATHQIVPLVMRDDEAQPVQVVGPVCETTDVLGRDVSLTAMQPGDHLAILTAGAYGMVMASNYNARPRPAEVIVSPHGDSWTMSRRRETWDDLLATQQEEQL